MPKTTKRKSACYCINIRRAANTVTNIYDSLLKSCGLSVNQYSLLINLSRLGEGSVSDLAAYVGLDRTTVVRTIKPLTENGLITDTSETGTRDRKLSVTNNGLAVLEAGQPLWEEAQRILEEKIGKENIVILSKILSMITE